MHSIEFVLYFLMALGAVATIIAIHELGHYLGAKLSGMSVSEFSIGIGKPIFSWRFRETNCHVRWFLIGGYVHISGFSGTRDEILAGVSRDEPETTSARFRILSDERTWYCYKPKWARLVALSGGVVLNLLLPLLLQHSIPLADPDRTKTSMVVMKRDDSFLVIGDIKNGDRILRVESRALPTSKEIREIASERRRKMLSVTILRDQVNLKPILRTIPSSTLLTLAEDGDLDSVAVTSEVREQAFRSLATHTSSAAWIVEQGHDRDTHGLSIVGIVQDGIVSASRGLIPLLIWMGVVSALIGWTNLLPLRPLDGSRILDVLLEREKSVRFSPEPRASKAKASGFAWSTLFLIALLAYAFAYDIHRLIVTIQHL